MVWVDFRPFQLEPTPVPLPSQPPSLRDTNVEPAIPCITYSRACNRCAHSTDPIQVCALSKCQCEYLSETAIKEVKCLEVLPLFSSQACCACLLARSCAPGAAVPAHCHRRVTAGAGVCLLCLGALAAGALGAQPGLLMRGSPRPGQRGRGEGMSSASLKGMES